MGAPPDQALRLAGIAIAGAALLGVSLLGSLSSMIASSAEEVAEGLRKGRAFREAALARAACDSLSAADWFEPARHLTDAALINSRLAPVSRPRCDRDDAIVRAALKRAPAQPFNWMRLALAAHDGRQMDDAARHWEMSVLAGRLVPGLMQPRVHFGLTLLSEGALNDGQVELLGEQIRLTARLHPFSLAQSAEALKVGPFLRAALHSDPDAADGVRPHLAQSASGRGEP